MSSYFSSEKLENLEIKKGNIKYSIEIIKVNFFIRNRRVKLCLRTLLIVFRASDFYDFYFELQIFDKIYFLLFCEIKQYNISTFLFT